MMITENANSNIDTLIRDKLYYFLQKKLTF